MQKLILPIRDMLFLVGYKVPIYKRQWGFVHYGIDCKSESGTRAICALGDGVVHSCGMDGATPKDRMGNCIVVVYKNVQLQNGKTVSLACRMQHFDKIFCKTGQAIKAGDILGEYGGTGKYSSEPHLHIEFDTDVSYPANAFGVSSGGKMIKRGTVDSTVNPSTVWFVGAGQSITAPAAWVKSGHSSAKDTAIPHLPQAPAPDDWEKRALLAESKLVSIQAILSEVR